MEPVFGRHNCPRGPGHAGPPLVRAPDPSGQRGHGPPGTDRDRGLRTAHRHLRSRGEQSETGIVAAGVIGLPPLAQRALPAILMDLGVPVDLRFSGGVPTEGVLEKDVQVWFLPTRGWPRLRSHLRAVP